MNILFLLQNAWGDAFKLPEVFVPNPRNKTAKVCRKIIGEGRTIFFSNVSPIVTDKSSDNPGIDQEYTNGLLNRINERKTFDLIIICGNNAKEAYDKSKVAFNGRVIRMPHPASRNLTNLLIAEVRKTIYEEEFNYEFLQLKGEFKKIKL